MATFPKALCLLPAPQSCDAEKLAPRDAACSASWPSQVPTWSSSCFDKVMICVLNWASEGLSSLTVIKLIKCGVGRPLLGSLRSSIMLRGQYYSKCPPAMTANAAWLTERSGPWPQPANSSITRENVNIDPVGLLCCLEPLNPPTRPLLYNNQILNKTSF